MHSEPKLAQRQIQVLPKLSSAAGAGTEVQGEGCANAQLIVAAAVVADQGEACALVGGYCLRGEGEGLA